MRLGMATGISGKSCDASGHRVASTCTPDCGRLQCGPDPLLVLQRARPQLSMTSTSARAKRASRVGVDAVRVRQHELVVEALGAQTDRAETLPARLPGERTGDVRLPRAGRAGDDDVLVPLDPAARRELADGGLSRSRGATGSRCPRRTRSRSEATIGSGVTRPAATSVRPS
jgi:hypothetical protein